MASCAVQACAVWVDDKYDKYQTDSLTHNIERILHPAQRQLLCDVRQTDARITRIDFAQPRFDDIMAQSQQYPAQPHLLQRPPSHTPSAAKRAHIPHIPHIPGTVSVSV